MLRCGTAGYRLAMWLTPSRPAGPLRADGTHYTELSRIGSGSNIAGCPTHATATHPAFVAAPRASIIRQ